MTKRSLCKLKNSRRLALQCLEQRKLLAADLMLQPASEQMHASEASAPGEVVSLAMPVEEFQNGFMHHAESDGSLWMEANGLLDSLDSLSSNGISIQDLGTIDVGTFYTSNMPLDGIVEEIMDGDMAVLTDWMDAIEVDGTFPSDIIDEISIDFEPETSPLDQAQAELVLYDSDADGTATGEEIATYLADSVGLRSIAADGAAYALLNSFDTNDDGALDVDELLVSYNQESAKSELDWLDQDGDGSATAAEISDRYLEAFGIRPIAAMGAAENMLETYDSNQDGGLDLNELTASYSIDTIELPKVVGVNSDSNSSDTKDSVGKDQVNAVVSDMNVEEVLKELGVSDDAIELIEEIESDTTNDPLIVVADNFEVPYEVWQGMISERMDPSVDEADSQAALLGISPSDLIGDFGSVSIELLDVFESELVPEEFTENVDFLNEGTEYMTLVSGGILGEGTDVLDKLSFEEFEVNATDSSEATDAPFQGVFIAEALNSAPEGTELLERIEHEMRRVQESFEFQGIDFWNSLAPARTNSNTDYFFAEFSDAEDDNEAFAWSLNEVALNLGSLV